MTSTSSLQAFESFLMVGARFSRITVDERKVSGDEGEYELKVSIEGHEPEVSKHTYAGRSVIEQVVSASAIVKGEGEGPDAPYVFFVECTAGFVGIEEKFDGDLAVFKEAETHFARALYWLVRERIQSVFSVTMLRTHRKLPWDLLAEQVGAQQKSKVAAKKVARKRPVAKKGASKASS
jgi:hypothetical protein